MCTEDKNDYYPRIETAIEFILEHSTGQPDLKDIAKAVHMSPFHFQRVFKTWAGISPKKFLQFITLQRAKTLLTENRETITGAANETGLSGSSRLHDLFIRIEAMTPGEFKHGGKSLHIDYGTYSSTFGEVLAASTAKGLCELMFIANENDGLTTLSSKYPNADMIKNECEIHVRALRVIEGSYQDQKPVSLHLKGTPFQLKVWQALLTIPPACLETYSGIAQKINKPGASRAVGSAIAKNPIAYLIPCHRVIQSTGYFGQYHWGTAKKTAMIGWEASKM